MSKFVLCTLAHAALEINGVAFEAVKGGVVSVDPVDDEAAERFASIPGYELVDAKPKAEKPVEQPAEKPVEPKTEKTAGAKAPAAGK